MTDHHAQAGDDQAFVQQVAAAQASLYGYAMKLLADSEHAREVLAETNLTLWQKRAEFEPGTSFFAWSSRVTYYEAMAYRKRMQRDRLYFDDDVVALLADESQDTADDDPRALDALAHCMGVATAQDRELIEKRYVEGLPAREIAADVGRSSHAISQALYRIRMSLRHCIERVLSSEESS